MDAVVGPAQLFDLTGRRALVTGASSGLGQRFARVLDAAGAQVALVARRRQRLEQLAEQLTRPAVVLPADLADPSHAEDVVARAQTAMGRLDVVVAGAGSGHVAKAEDESLQDARELLELNVLSTFALARRAARAMPPEGGSVILVGSILGIVGLGKIPQASYAASKAALHGLARELAAQWAPRGVRVNALVPGWFPSELTEQMLADQAAERWLSRRTPLGRPGRAGELDGALLLLASSAGSYLTGQALVVDGGWTSV